MALHRNIHWLGRQWAVTDYGMQVINQKHSGRFDIEIDRLWDEGLDQGLRAQIWFNADDFSKGLVIARARYPEPPRKAPPPLPVETPPWTSSAIAPPPTPLQLETLKTPKAEPAEAPKPVPPSPELQDFHMRIDGQARFVRPWRIRLRQ